MDSVIFGIYLSLAWRIDSVNTFPKLFTPCITGSFARRFSSSFEKLLQIVGLSLRDFILVNDFFAFAAGRKNCFRSDLEGK